MWHLVESIGGSPIALSRGGEAAKPTAVDEGALGEQSGRGTRARLEASHNVRRVFDKMGTMGINVVGCSPQDIVAGARSNHALGVVWAITLRAMHDEGNAKGYSLLRWAAVHGDAEDDAVDLDEDPVFLEELLSPTSAATKPTPREEEDNEEEEEVTPRLSEPASPTITIRNLDTGLVLKVTPRTLHCSSGLIGDDNTINRHHDTLNVWNSDQAVPTEF